MSLLTIPVLTTALDAVNLMLDTIGEPPVNSLEDVTDEDVAMAIRMLGVVSRNFQTRGWEFNSETNYPMSPDINGEITLATNIARLDATNPGIDVTVRGNRLYDKTNRRYTFTQDVKVDVVWLLPYEEIPQAARDYIAIKAARQFQRRIQGDAVVEQYTAQEELDALTVLIDAEVEAADTNIFNEHAAFRVVNRRI